MLKQTVEPTEYPVSLEDAKKYLRVDHAIDDDEIEGMIAVATQFVENVTGLQLITATWEQTLDFKYRQIDHIVHGQSYDAFRQKDIPMQRWEFPVRRELITLGRGPCQSISTFQYYDPEGNSQTFTDYILDKRSVLARLAPDSNHSWPTVQNRLETSKITFVAGYGDAEDVPSLLKQAIKWLVRLYYDQEPVSDKKLYDLPFGLRTVLNMYKTQVFG